jgi:phospholipase/carboxylesterase
MHRIQQAIRPSEPKPSEPIFEVESALFSPSVESSPRAMFTPLHYEAAYAYPLLVWLHGAGMDENQLSRIMPVVSMRNYVAVAPRGLPNADGEAPWPQTPESIFRAQQLVFDAVDAARERFNVAPDRVFLAGMGTGGTMAFRIAMHHADQFAGVLSICGAFPSDQRPLCRLDIARHLPVFLAVGRDSQQFSPAQACENLKLFHSAGMSVSLRQYPCAHQLTPQMLADVDRWVMEQVAPQGNAPQDSDTWWSDSSE